MRKLTQSPLPLLGILLLALALRVWGLTWGLPSSTHYFSYHPDESVVLETASITMNPLAGHLLPHFYNYGSLQLYLVSFANTLAALFGAADIVPKDFAVWYPQWAKMYLVGRLLTVGMGVGTVWAVYAIGCRLWGRRAGLLSALTLAIIPLHAQHSHFLTVDVPATFWGTLALLWAVRLATGDPKPLRAALLAGLFAGLATATKYNMALAILPLLTACVLRGPEEPLPARDSPPSPVREGQKSKAKGAASSGSSLTGGSTRSEERAQGEWGSSGWVPQAGFLSIGLLAFVFAFFAACPGAILENAKFLEGLRFESIHVQNANDPTFRDTGSGFVYHIARNLDAGLGHPLLVLALVSVGYAIYRRERGDSLLAAFALPYYVLISLAAVRYARYTIPLLPILALWVGRILTDWSRLPRPLLQKATIAIGAAVLLLTFIWCFRLVGFMAEQDMRDWAYRWMNSPIWLSKSIQVSKPAALPTVGFAAQPWFGTPPLSPYFPTPHPGGWREATPPDIMRRIVYDGKDWDTDLLTAKKPDIVVLSEFDYMDVLRLKDPAALRYFAVLTRDYKRSFVLVDNNSALSTQYRLVEGMPTRGWPHDMLYTNPIITFYRRKTSNSP